MVTINSKQKVAKRPEDRPIDATGWCGLCIYNIPQGTMMILMPGIVLLLVGALLLAIWQDQMGLISASLGGALTMTGLLFWLIMWCRYRPNKVKKQHHSPVQLVGVYQISSNHLSAAPS